MQRSQEAPAHAVDPSQSETKPACQARRSTESPTTHPAGAADNDRSMHMPPCPSGQMHPHNRNARAVHAQAQPQCPSGPRHQDAHATITPQCPSGPWQAAQDTKTLKQPSHRNARAVHGQAQPQCPSGSGTTITPQCPSGPRTSAAAMPERLRDNHAPATPQCHGQAQPQCPSGLGTLTQPAHRNARAVHASNPQCPIGRGATTGGSTKDKRAEHVRPQVSRVVSSPAAARARPSNLVRDGR